MSDNIEGDAAGYGAPLASSSAPDVPPRLCRLALLPPPDQERQLQPVPPPRPPRTRRAVEARGAEGAPSTSASSASACSRARWNYSPVDHIPPKSRRETLIDEEEEEGTDEVGAAGMAAQHVPPALRRLRQIGRFFLRRSRRFVACFGGRQPPPPPRSNNPALGFTPHSPLAMFIERADGHLALVPSRYYLSSLNFFDVGRVQAALSDVLANESAASYVENANRLLGMSWYFGPLDSVQAETILAGRPDGTFLVRDSSNGYFSSLSFRVLGVTRHTRIEFSGGRFRFWSQSRSHSASSIVEFIQSAVEHSRAGRFHYFVSPAEPGGQQIRVSMINPMSRSSVMTSLRHRCRLEIVSRVRQPDKIALLPLPRCLRDYLLEKQVFIESLADHVYSNAPAAGSSG